jgi:hypothetical protein
MQTLLFNTSTKTIKLYDGPVAQGNILLEMNDIPTVKVMEDYYEVRQYDLEEKQLPVLRLGIQSTNMIIKK